MERELKGIRELSFKYDKLTTLINRIDASSLMVAHEEQCSRKASGIDGVTKQIYGENLIGNVTELVRRMKSFEYYPQPVRRVYIPKANGSMRPLGIPSYEDKLVQSVMAEILREVYEPRFLNCSYGFREGRGAHDVVRQINSAVMHENVRYVLEADIKGFFDNLDHVWLMRFLEHDIADKKFLRYIRRFLKAGVMEGNQCTPSDKGSPQGGLISPTLANVYLHYVLDLWLGRRVRKYLKGHMRYLRYADDFICLFQYEEDAQKVMSWMRMRLAKFGLEMAEDKTRILPFGRYRGTKEKFDFLGFTFVNTKTRYGKYRLAVITSQKKLKSKRASVKTWLRKRLTKPVVETLKLLNLALQGHYNYYGVNGNCRALQSFTWYVRHRTMRMLRRRSQRSNIRWEKFNELWERYVSPPRIKVNIWA